MFRRKNLKHGFELKDALNVKQIMAFPVFAAEQPANAAFILDEPLQRSVDVVPHIASLFRTAASSVRAKSATVWGRAYDEFLTGAPPNTLSWMVGAFVQNISLRVLTAELLLLKRSDAAAGSRSWEELAKKDWVPLDSLNMLADTEDMACLTITLKDSRRVGHTKIWGCAGLPGKNDGEVAVEVVFEDRTVKGACGDTARGTEDQPLQLGGIVRFADSEMRSGLERTLGLVKVVIQSDKETHGWLLRHRKIQRGERGFWGKSTVHRGSFYGKVVGPDGSRRRIESLTIGIEFGRTTWDAGPTQAPSFSGGHANQEKHDR
ncbi:hypothetical protein K438DRAFT_1748218 [Mycena galopus ATCC 62051]|nr:hypothetical protein K438DRAFT_1748218 [Mycena galopus ATCC 62051]